MRRVGSGIAALRTGLRATRTGSGPAVRYGFARIPGADEVVAGPVVKFQRLAGAIPESDRFNVLYLASGALTVETRLTAWAARRRGARIVLNQNGVAYPAVYGAASERINRPMGRALHDAEHVFFQSEFCRLSADRFLGPRAGPAEVLHNAVDTGAFVPRRGRRSPGGRLVLLLAGTQHAEYRLTSALAMLAELRTRREATLVVAGRLAWADADGPALAARHGVATDVELVGPYRQREARDLYARADVLVHTQYNDASPGLVLEAMACGLPVAYSASGGTPELVGEDAGRGVPAPLDWERVHPPDPVELANAVESIAANLDDCSAAARDRAVRRFDIGPWIQRHREVFAELAERP